MIQTTCNTTEYGEKSDPHVVTNGITFGTILVGVRTFEGTRGVRKYNLALFEAESDVVVSDLSKPWNTPVYVLAGSCVSNGVQGFKAKYQPKMFKLSEVRFPTEGEYEEYCKSKTI